MTGVVSRIGSLGNEALVDSKMCCFAVDIISFQLVS